MKFIIALGLVSLFADMTYEAARSITGPYLAFLGASGALVGTVAGLGELINYAFRILSGYITDRFKQHWKILSTGYVINLSAVPLLAFATTIPTAAVLILLERFGKSIRNPPRDAMLSYAAQSVGRGWAFGIHQSMDQAGAVMGPLIVAALLAWTHSYPTTFAVLALPAIASLTTLAIAHRLFPHPEKMETEPTEETSDKLSRSFWWIVAGGACVAAGYVDFSLIGYHFVKASVLSEAQVPIVYALAGMAHALSALGLGRLYDRLGSRVLISATAIAALFPFFAFSLKPGIASLGALLWGAGLGVQEGVSRAIIADTIPKAKRATAYGLFNGIFGVAWFAGSVLLGLLYDISIPALITFSVVAQLCALPFFWKGSTQK